MKTPPFTHPIVRTSAVHVLSRLVHLMPLVSEVTTQRITTSLDQLLSEPSSPHHRVVGLRLCTMIAPFITLSPLTVVSLVRSVSTDIHHNEVIMALDSLISQSHLFDANTGRLVVSQLHIAIDEGGWYRYPHHLKLMEMMARLNSGCTELVEFGMVLLWRVIDRDLSDLTHLTHPTHDEDEEEGNKNGVGDSDVMPDGGVWFVRCATCSAAVRAATTLACRCPFLLYRHWTALRRFVGYASGVVERRLGSSTSLNTRRAVMSLTHQGVNIIATAISCLRQLIHAHPDVVLFESNPGDLVDVRGYPIGAKGEGEVGAANETEETNSDGAMRYILTWDELWAMLPLVQACGPESIDAYLSLLLTVIRFNSLRDTSNARLTRITHLTGISSTDHLHLSDWQLRALLGLTSLPPRIKPTSRTANASLSSTNHSLSQSSCNEVMKRIENICESSCGAMTACSSFCAALFHLMWSTAYQVNLEEIEMWVLKMWGLVIQAVERGGSNQNDWKLRRVVGYCLYVAECKNKKLSEVMGLMLVTSTATVSLSRPESAESKEGQGMEIEEGKGDTVDGSRVRGEEVMLLPALRYLRLFYKSSKTMIKGATTPSISTSTKPHSPELPDIQPPQLVFNITPPPFFRCQRKQRSLCPQAAQGDTGVTYSNNRDVMTMEVALSPHSPRCISQLVSLFTLAISPSPRRRTLGGDKEKVHKVLKKKANRVINGSASTRDLIPVSSCEKRWVIAYREALDEMVTEWIGHMDGRCPQCCCNTNHSVSPDSSTFSSTTSDGVNSKKLCDTEVGANKMSNALSEPTKLKEVDGFLLYKLAVCCAVGGMASHGGELMSHITMLPSSMMNHHWLRALELLFKAEGLPAQRPPSWPPSLSIQASQLVLLNEAHSALTAFCHLTQSRFTHALFLTSPVSRLSEVDSEIDDGPSLVWGGVSEVAGHSPHSPFALGVSDVTIPLPPISEYINLRTGVIRATMNLVTLVRGLRVVVSSVQASLDKPHSLQSTHLPHFVSSVDQMTVKVSGVMSEMRTIQNLWSSAVHRHGVHSHRSLRAYNAHLSQTLTLRIITSSLLNLTHLTATKVREVESWARLIHSSRPPHAPNPQQSPRSTLSRDPHHLPGSLRRCLYRCLSLLTHLWEMRGGATEVGDWRESPSLMMLKEGWGRRKNGETGENCKITRVEEASDANGLSDWFPCAARVCDVFERVAVHTVNMATVPVPPRVLSPTPPPWVMVCAKVRGGLEALSKVKGMEGVKVASEGPEKGGGENGVVSGVSGENAARNGSVSVAQISGELRNCNFQVPSGKVEWVRFRIVLPLRQVHSERAGEGGEESRRAQKIEVSGGAEQDGARGRNEPSNAGDDTLLNKFLIEGTDVLKTIIEDEVMMEEVNGVIAFSCMRSLLLSVEELKNAFIESVPLSPDRTRVVGGRFVSRLALIEE
eukprot:GHVN01099067.1.p1 GENE.GHVN01099067.1~~GHVN01099067.1.p1  ORF type:complete len:1614 (-),score=436.60 GHVN01099067.1:318-4619(-)